MHRSRAYVGLSTLCALFLVPATVAAQDESIPATSEPSEAIPAEADPHAAPEPAGEDPYAAPEPAGEDPYAAPEQLGDDPYAAPEQLGDDPYGAVSVESAAPVSSGADDAGFTLSDISLRWSGRIQAGLHYRVDNRSVGPFYDRILLPDGFSRYETSLKLRLEAAAGPFRGVAEIDFDWLGYGDDRYGAFEDLTRREELNPVRLEAHALYLEGTDLLIEGLDLRIGQQVVQWGVADQFNPTNSLNPEDLDNVLLFGQQAANFMVRADYSFLDTWTLSGVVVPIFRPSILPRSARVAAGSVDRLPFVDEEYRWLVHSEREFALDNGVTDTPTVVRGIETQLPRFTLENMQAMVRLAGVLFEQDVALSYYYGRDDMPIAIRNHTEQRFEPQCDPLPFGDCVDSFLDSTVTLAYPKVQVVGLNFAGEMPVLPIGYRFELGIFIPQARRAKVTTGDVRLILPEPLVDQRAGEHPTTRPVPGDPSREIPLTADGGRPFVVEDVPFAKWTFGLDYSIGRYFYVNAMWVHGFADEFGAGDWLHEGYAVRAGGVSDRSPLESCVLNRDGQECAFEILRPRIGDFLVLGVDFKFDDQRGLLRLFTIFELSGYQRTEFDSELGERVTTSYSPFSEEGFSAVLYPEIGYGFGNGLELGGGALLQLGQSYTKFGDPATGGSLVFVHGRYSF